jgi:hypothetical protein
MLDNTTIVLERYGDAGWHITLGRKNVMTTDVFVLSNRHRPFMPTEKWAYVMRHALSNIFPFIYVPSYAFGWDDNHKRAMIKIPNPDDVKISNDIIRRVSVIGHTRDISMSEFVKRIQDVIKQRPEVKQTTEEPAEPIPF